MIDLKLGDGRIGHVVLLARPFHNVNVLAECATCGNQQLFFRADAETISDWLLTHPCDPRQAEVSIARARKLFP